MKEKGEYVLKFVKGKKIIPDGIKKTLRCIFRNLGDLKSFLLLKNSLNQYFYDYKDIRSRLSNALNCAIIVTAYKILEKTKDSRPESIYKLLHQLEALPGIYNDKIFVEKKLREIKNKLTDIEELQRKIVKLRHNEWAHQGCSLHSNLSRKELGECIKIISCVITDIIQLLISDGFNLPDEYSPVTSDKVYKQFRGLVKCILVKNNT